jgi:hypothetical protein
VRNLRPVSFAADRARRRDLPDVRPDGRRRSCAHIRPEERGAAEAPEERRASLPWHLWLLAAAVAVYLGFRAWQGIEWIIQQL